MRRRSVVLTCALVGALGSVAAATGAGLRGRSARQSAQQRREVELNQWLRQTKEANTGRRAVAARRRRGRPGPPGLTGPQGPPGGFTTANITTVNGATVTLCPYGSGSCDIGSSVARCPEGKKAIGGGWDGENAPPLDAGVAYNRPVEDVSWGVSMINNSGITATFHAVAVCAG
jgi:hypothetical protein